MEFVGSTVESFTVSIISYNLKFVVNILRGKRRTTQLEFRLKNTAFLNKAINHGSNIVIDSLKLLEWDQLCDSVSSFASTTMGKQSLKEQLWCLDKSYEDRLKLLEETNAAVQMNNYGAMLDFDSIDILLHLAVDEAEESKCAHQVKKNLPFFKIGFIDVVGDED